MPYPHNHNIELHLNSNCQSHRKLKKFVKLLLPTIDLKNRAEVTSHHRLKSARFFGYFPPLRLLPTNYGKKICDVANET